MSTTLSKDKQIELLWGLLQDRHYWWGVSTDGTCLSGIHETGVDDDMIERLIDEARNRDELLEKYFAKKIEQRMKG